MIAALDDKPLDPFRIVSDIVEPPERLGVSDWSDRYRVLNAQFAAEPGPWRTSRVPYMREPMDEFSGGSATFITILKAAQCAGTEVMNNCLLWLLDRNPAPVMWVLPTQQDAIDEATGRLKHCISDCAPLDRFIPHENFATGRRIVLRGTRTITMAWAAAPRTMIRKAICDLFFDELDNCEQECGKLGNHLVLAGERTTTYGDRARVFDVSTPRTYDGAAYTAFLESDQRHYWVPCPRCGKYQVLNFSNIKWPNRETLGTELTPAERADAIETGNLAWYECKHCAGRIEQTEREWMVERGCWIPKSQKPTDRLPIADVDVVEAAGRTGADRWVPKLTGKRRPTRRIGFHIWSIYSPWRTFSDIAGMFLRCKDDPEKLRVFVNSWLGEPWSDKVVAHEESDIENKRADGLPRDVVPAWVKRICVGADVQRGMILYIVRGWGTKRRSTLIREGMCATFGELESILAQEYEIEGSDETKHAEFLAVDSGDQTHRVYDFTRRTPGAVPVKGVDERDWAVRPSRVEYLRANKKKKNSVVLHLVNGPYYKDMLSQLIEVPHFDAGYWGVHADTTKDYCRQMVSEHKVRVRRTVNGRRVEQERWLTKTAHRANHYLDAEIYAMALADHRGWLNLPRERQKTKRQPATQSRPGGLARAREHGARRRPAN